jgi:hypothetical protein
MHYFFYLIEDSAGRSAISGKENGISLIMGKGSGSTPITNMNMDVKASTFMPRYPHCPYKINFQLFCP